jgi:outer membrane lipoprotein-sorting protein
MERDNRMKDPKTARHAPRVVFPGVLALALLAAAAVFAQEGAARKAPSGEEILRSIDANAQVKSASYEASMTVSSGKKRLVKEMKGLTSGDRGIIEFTNPEDRGVKYLKVGDELWIYFPEEDDTVRVSGSQLKEGLMGSDLSYEDAMETEELTQKYAVTVEGEEELDGRKAWILVLVARVKNVPYDRLKLWVDEERFLSLKEEMYSKSGTLLKTSAITEVERIQGRWVAMVFEMRDKRKKDSLTVFELKGIRFDVSVDEKAFSLRALRK